jgi:hypothetical protein
MDVLLKSGHRERQVMERVTALHGPSLCSRTRTGRMQLLALYREIWTTSPRIA